MSNLQTAAQQALKALEYYRSGEDYHPTPASEAISSIQAALSAQPEPAAQPTAALRADAERYRWLCEFQAWPEAVCEAFDCFGKFIIDEAIDAAMQSEKAVTP